MIKFDLHKEYIQHVGRIRAINPKYQSLAKKWYLNFRKYDYWVDVASVWDDVDPRKVKHADRNSERCFDSYIFIQSKLPKREVANLVKQVQQFSDEDFAEIVGSV